jgi:hypothetical protein
MFQKLIAGAAKVSKYAALMSIIVDTIQYFQTECKTRGLSTESFTPSPAAVKEDLENA